ncbi:MAG TPA: ATP-binding domain-containing protein, partial [Thermoanaerobaculia bacterium]|nr:ATP-binding domain-containing protein [Thermoanaerobaculia bacterium]
GRIVEVMAPQRQLTVSFDGRRVVYNDTDLDELALAYAITIHKSQGSEYPAVVIPLLTQHFVMLSRNLVYTAVTRGKKLVVIAGEKAALQKAVSTASTRRRWTKLGEWLTQPT